MSKRSRKMTLLKETVNSEEGKTDMGVEKRPCQNFLETMRLPYNWTWILGI